MNRKERILSYIKSKEYVPLKFDELAMVLDVPASAYPELGQILDSLMDEGQILISKRGRYAPVNGANTVSGELVCNPRGRFGFVICGGDDDVFVAGEDMMSALNGDRVLVRIKDGRTRGKREGRVIKILGRANKIIVGVVHKEKNGFLYVRPDSGRIYAEVSVAMENAGEAEVGDRVAVSEIEYGKTGHIYGTITEVLGDELSLKSLTDGIIIGNGIKREFDAETIREAALAPQTVTGKQLDGREDLRGKLIFTIDGDDAKDFDDAISLERSDDGNYLLGVHIADVSEYVREKSAIDLEAYERGTSVYLADRVIPMLPENLSNGICSLNPDVDRLTFSCFMEIDKSGTVKDYRLSKTVIRSVERMTYNNVNVLLAGEDEALAGRYARLLPTLKEMEGLAEILRSKRIQRGAIQFDFPECHIVMGEDGEPEKIEQEERGVSNRMIEEFMLAANETVAEYAYWSEIPFIYRTHEPPSADKVRAFNKLILRFGLQIKGKTDENNPIKPKVFQKVLDEIKDSAGERVVSNEMLRSMMKAKYTPDNPEHFGLAAKYYCHFTSPIRRYPDLAIHRILKRLCDGDMRGVNSHKDRVSDTALHSSEKEIAAEQTERDVDDLMKAAYMSRFIGKSFEGVISNVMGFGMFVELDNTVEGLVRLENMTDDYYEFDENLGTVTGRRTGKTYTAGDYVTVVAVKSDIISRRIDFVLEEDAEKM